VVKDLAELTKDQALVAVAIIIMLFSAMLGWNIYSWLMLLGMIVFLFAWYFKK